MTYPLVEWNIDKRTINDWWKKQDFKLDLEEHQGNCDFCWKKSEKKLVKLTNENPAGLDWWERMERLYSTIQLEGRGRITEPTFFFRGKRSAADIRELATASKAQGNLFEALSEEETDCFCKAT